jgi:hypothetical protein
VWKQIYIDYQTTHPDSYLVEETFKNRLWDILKELKTKTSNQEASEKATLQCDQMFKHLKATTRHVTRNVKETSKSN